MCGIVGFISPDNFESARGTLPEAVSSLSHRGPDDSGLFFDTKAGVGLGHRRLSILDLSRAGRQPMTTEDGKTAIVYNGEVYNFREIRETLKNHGHSFHTGTDTEVILKAYLEWGVDCVTRFIGMFAFALWDGHRRSLFLARDRLGIKPLYYYRKGKTILFASELKAIMAFKDFQRDPDSDSIPLFLHYQYVPSPRTIFRNTYKLLPGHYALFDGRTLTCRCYWEHPDQLDIGTGSEISENEILEQLDSILTKAVSDRLISDVPLGALLSGGIDSSMVVALMQKTNTSPVRTFSIGFEEPGYNEAPWSSAVAEHLRTDHTELYVTPKQSMEIIPRLPEIYDEPFADSSAIPTFLVSRLARSRVTVVLSGDGGDEQFAGYVRYWTARSIADNLSKLPRFCRKAISLALANMRPGWMEPIYLPLRRFLPQRFRVANFRDKWQKLISLFDQNSVNELYRMTISLWSDVELIDLLGRELPESRYEEIFRETECLPLLSRLMRVDQGTYLPDAMLTKVDRASMANSLEVRVPLLDHRVVEYTSQLPEMLKYRNGTGKFILRQLLDRYLPKKLFDRPKMGFGVPVGHWLRTDLKPLLLDYLSPSRLRKEGLFNCAIVDKKIREHLSGKVDHQYRLWSLLMWEMWREHWL